MRNEFKKIFKKYAELGKGNVRLTQSTLILTKPILSTTTNYLFDMLENEGKPINPEDIRLNKNDEFVTTQIAVYLCGTAKQDTITSQGFFKLTSYPPIETDSKFLKVGGLYNGIMKVSVNNIVYIEKWDLQRHLYISEQQYQETDTFKPVALFNIATQQELNTAKDGFYPLLPNIVFSGAKKNDIEIKLPAPISPVITAYMWGQHIDLTPEPYLLKIDKIAVVLRGYNAQNGAKFQ